MNHPNWFDASCIPWLSYDSMHLELPDVHMFLRRLSIGENTRKKNSRLVMPVTVSLESCVIADGYLVANVFVSWNRRLRGFVEL